MKRKTPESTPQSTPHSTPQSEGKRPLRLLIADDNPGARAGLCALLESVGGSDGEMEVLEASNGQDAVTVVEEAKPDVVLLDVQMPKLSGVEVTRIIKARWPAIRVIVLTMHRMHRAAALAAGADLFLLKGCPAEQLLTAISSQPSTGDRE